MHRIREVILVEGRYDKNALRQVVDATVLETSGFGIFNDRQKQRLLCSLAQSRGLIVMTDSDGAGFVIRNFIRSCVPADQVKHAYIPDIYGKERRKKTPSREGKKGVEGMPPQVLLDALVRCGATIDDTPAERSVRTISKADLYVRGLSGRQGSRRRRQRLIRMLDLPEHLSPDALLEVLNALMDRETFMTLSLEDPQHRPEQ